MKNSFLFGILFKKISALASSSVLLWKCRLSFSCSLLFLFVLTSLSLLRYKCKYEERKRKSFILHILHSNSRRVVKCVNWNEKRQENNLLNSKSPSFKKKFLKVKLAFNSTKAMKKKIKIEIRRNERENGTNLEW